MVIKITPMDVQNYAVNIVQDKGYAVIEECMDIVAKYTCFLPGLYLFVILQVIPQGSVCMTFTKVCYGLVFCNTSFMCKGVGFTGSPGQALVAVVVVVMRCFCKEFAVSY